MFYNHLFYPQNYYLTRIISFIDDNKCLDDTIIFSVDKNESQLEFKMFENINNNQTINVKCKNKKDNINLETEIKCKICKDEKNFNINEKVEFYPKKYDTLNNYFICSCKETCVFMQNKINPYYRRTYFSYIREYFINIAPIFFGFLCGLLFGLLGLKSIKISNSNEKISDLELRDNNYIISEIKNFREKNIFSLNNLKLKTDFRFNFIKKKDIISKLNNNLFDYIVQENNFKYL